MKKNKLRNAVALLVAGGIIGFSSCSKEGDRQLLSDSGSEISGKPANSLLFAPQAKMYGKTRAEWATEAVKWAYSFDCAHSPFLDTTGALQEQNQSGDVFFLAGRRNYDLSVTVPHDVSIFMPVLGLLDWYPGTSGNRVPNPGQTPEDFLDSLGYLYNSDIGESSITIDGLEVGGIQNSYELVAPIFSYSANAQLSSCLAPTLTGQPQLFLASGTWVMLKPLEPGPHTIVRKSLFRGFNLEYRYQINQL